MVSEEIKKGIPKAIRTGKFEPITEEDKERCNREAERVLKQLGILKENESIEDYEVT